MRRAHAIDRRPGSPYRCARRCHPQLRCPSDPRSTEPAGRNPRPARISAEVDVNLAAARLTPDETDQIASVAADGLAVAVPPADPRVQRVRHPGRAINGRLNAVRERLPTASPRYGA